VRYELALRSSNRRFEALLDKKIEGVTITAPIIEGDDAGGRVELPSIDFGKLTTRGATGSGFARVTKP
jgi:hypothetical protein